MMDGPPRMVAWQPGQVGNEAAIPNNYQCRGFGSSFAIPTSLSSNACGTPNTSRIKVIAP